MVGQKNIFLSHFRVAETSFFKDRIHFLTPASAVFEIRQKMVFLTSGMLKNMFFDNFERYEKIDFVDFFDGK